MPLKPVINLFEDNQTDKFAPLADFRALYELRCGLYTGIERLERLYSISNQPFELNLFCRQALRALQQTRHTKSRVYQVKATPSLFLNSRLILTEAIPIKALSTRLYLDGQFVGVRLSARESETLCMDLANGNSPLASDYEHIPKTIINNGYLIEWPWDLIKLNRTLLTDDIRAAVPNDYQTELPPAVHKIADDKLFISDSARIDPTVVFDTTTGPIYIGDRVHIEAGALIQGPFCIGERSIVVAGSRISAVSAGLVCKLGGEITDCIFAGYDNKQHAGFLGHSYISRWCNFGADTNNSNLKNTYNLVTMPYQEQNIETDMQFLGLLAGEFVRTAIGTRINTGTKIGTASTLFDAAFPPRNIANFSWGTNSDQPYDIERLIPTLKAMMARRDHVLSTEMEQRLRQLFHLSVYTR